MPKPNKAVFIIISLVFLVLALFFLWQSYRLYHSKKKIVKPYVYACSPSGQCLVYPEDIALQLCPLTFQSKNCDNQCDQPNNQCRQ